MHKPQQAPEHCDEAIESKLPLTVTRISVQKKNQNRYSLFHDNLFLIGIGRKARENFSVSEGVTLTPSLFQQLCSSENLAAIKEACLRYLSGRDHSSFELRQKVEKKGYNKSDIEQVINDLSDSGYLNDEDFVTKYVDEKMDLNQWGPQKIRSYLFKKGIDRTLIDKVLQRKTDDLQLHKICVDLVMKRKRHFLREDDPYKRKQKVCHYLAGRGFSGSVIKKSLPQITDKLHA